VGECDNVNAVKSSTDYTRHLTIRQVPPDLARALEQEKRLRGTSMNRTVLDLLARALGLDPVESRRNGLADLAGTWSQAELEEFEQAVAPMEQVDEELWR
jgi:hypothetical protein